MSDSSFRFEVIDGVATVTIDIPGEAVNTLGPGLLDEFATMVDRVAGDPEIRGLVITSGKRDFIVGADIRWFGTLGEPGEAERAISEGQQAFQQLEDLHRKLGKRVVMAITGAALGGGLELALAGSHRVVANDPATKLGQPEVQLGLLPAAGGTQRLPRLIGLAGALDMILTGKPVDARKARKLGLVDEVAPPELVVEVARRIAGGNEVGGKRDGAFESGRKLALEKNPVGRSVVFSQARKKVLQETHGNYPAPLRALDAVRIGVEDGIEAGLAAEARFFGELVVSPESKALRSIFFSQRELQKETYGAEPRPVAKVAVLGGGLMGGGIAAVSTVTAGVAVRIKEIDPAGAGRGLAYVRRYIDSRLKRRRLTPFEAERAMLRVTATDRWDGFAGTDLVIEAVFEDIDVKQSILKEVEQVVGPNTVFASNTSSLPITEIAQASSRPESVLGMHYFSPVEKMPLLEVITTKQTADWAVSTAVEFGRRQGKTVIVVSDATGFYTSRVLGPYSNEAMYLLTEGASVESIDDAMVAWGFPVGPLLLADEVGIDVGAKISKIMVDAFGDRMRGPDTMAGLVADQRHGRKNGRGFYSYEKGKRDGVDETVYAAFGTPDRRAIAREEIQERLSLQFLNEAARCLEDGVLHSARDGDIGAVFGVGFPAFRGGPFLWIDQVGAEQVVDSLRRYEERFGPRFTPASILVEAAANGSRFRD